MATESESGSLLAVILDVNTSQGSFFGQVQTRLTQWLDTSLTLVNSHLLLNQLNEAALISAGSTTCSFLYPRITEENEALPEANDGQFEGKQTPVFPVKIFKKITGLKN
jgi:hypothetical protein